MKKLGYAILGLTSFVLTLSALSYIPPSVQELYKQNEESAVKVICIITADGDYGMYHGSGFFITEDGLVGTAAHVIYDEEKNIYAQFVILSNNKREYYRAEVYKIDLEHDIAILKTKQELHLNKFTPKNISVQSTTDITKKFKAVKFGTSKSLKVGDKVYSIGYPTVYFNILTEGMIITDHPQLVPSKDTKANYSDVLASDMFSQHGNSGSVMMNNYGEAIGVITMGLETSPLTLFQRIEYLQKLMEDTSTKVIVSEKTPYDEEPSFL